MRKSILSFVLLAYVVRGGLPAGATGDAELLEEAIRIPSVSSDIPQVNRMVGLFRERAEGMDLACRVETMPNGRQVLFVANTDTTVPDVLLSCHLDVVPAQTPELFVPRRDAECVYGRGASDCKEHCVLALRLMRELKGEVSVGCLFGSDEEIGGASTAWMLGRGYGARKLVIVMDAEQYAITTWQKGLAEYVIVRTAAAVHGGFVKGATPNAARDLVKDYLALTGELPETAPDGRWCDLVALKEISGGRERAEMKLTVRCAERGGWERLERLIRARIPGEMTCTRKGDPVRLDESDPRLVEFLRRMRGKWPDRDIGFYHMNSSTDARHLQALGLPMLIIGVDARGAHTPEERVRLVSLDEYDDLIRNYLRDGFPAR